MRIIELKVEIFDLFSARLQIQNQLQRVENVMLVKIAELEKLQKEQSLANKILDTNTKATNGVNERDN